MIFFELLPIEIKAGWGKGPPIPRLFLPLVSLWLKGISPFHCEAMWLTEASDCNVAAWLCSRVLLGIMSETKPARPIISYESPNLNHITAASAKCISISCSAATRCFRIRTSCCRVTASRLAHGTVLMAAESCLCITLGLIDRGKGGEFNTTSGGQR